MPSGVVTFVFTDIVGSTRLWESRPALMGAAMARHDELVEAAVTGAGGFVVRPRGEGDSRFAVFASARDAIAAAAAINLALQAEQWQTSAPIRVRTAVHTGEAELRAGDYYGDVVNRCARLRGVAHPGQILVSSTTASLAGAALPAELSLTDLGEHWLKDLTRPEHVFQLGHPLLPSAFAPLLSLKSVSVTVRAAPRREGRAARLQLPGGERVALDGARVTLGRSFEADITLEDPLASRTHAAIRFAGSSFRITDLNSTNGTRVNDIKISEHDLADGDRITIANTTIIFGEDSR